MKLFGISFEKQDKTYRQTEAFRLNEIENVINMHFEPTDWFIFFDDFLWYDDTASVGNWTLAEDEGNSPALIDAHGGILDLQCDGDVNDASTISSMTECLKFQANKKAYFEAYVKLFEANDDDAIVFIGVSSVVTTSLMQNADAGPAGTYDGAGFFKVDGGTVWQFETSNAGTQNTDTDIGNVSSGSWIKLGFAYYPNDGTTAKVSYYVDDTYKGTQDLTISGLEEMHVALSIKAGGDKEEEMYVDYVKLAAER